MTKGEERIFNLLVGRKNFLSIDQIADRLGYSTGWTGLALRSLHEKNLLDMVKLKQKKLYRIKE
jgi:DNA-binding transcriptional regulator GbsR (MarR family)